MDDERRTLREILPWIEIEWLLPAWLLVVILTAAAAETITIGLAGWTTYHQVTGWAVGATIASVQAIGSQMLARALQHNARRHVRHKTVGPKDARRVVEDTTRSEPRLDQRLPAAMSALAGVASAVIALTLYGADGSLTPMDVAMSVFAPVGSVGAALLNGLFAYGEQAVAHWQASQLMDGRSASGRSTGVRPSNGRPRAGKSSSKETPGEASSGRPAEGDSASGKRSTGRSSRRSSQESDGGRAARGKPSSGSPADRPKDGKAPSGRRSSRAKSGKASSGELSNGPQGERTSTEAAGGRASSGVEVSQGLAGHLAALRDRLTIESQNGRGNGIFTRADVEGWLGVSRSHAHNILSYGKETGLVEQLPGYTYRFRPGGRG